MSGTVYLQECGDCGIEWYTRSKHKAKRCRPCYVKSLQGKRPENIKSKEKKKYYRTCEACGDVKEVSCSANAKSRWCSKCANKHKEKPKSYNTNSRYDKDKAMQKSIEKQRNINRQHKARLEKEGKIRKLNVSIVQDDKMDRKMIDNWLKKNKPSVVSHPDFTHIEQKMSIADEYEGARI